MSDASLLAKVEAVARQYDELQAEASLPETSTDVAAIRRWLAVTESFWEHWSYFNHYRGRHAEVVRRSAVTLKLLTHAPTGAFIAAPRIVPE